MIWLGVVDCPRRHHRPCTGVCEVRRLFQPLRPTLYGWEWSPGPERPASPTVTTGPRLSLRGPVSWGVGDPPSFPGPLCLSSPLCLPPAWLPAGGRAHSLWVPGLPPTPYPYSPPCSFLFPVQCATPSPPTSPASLTPPANPLSSDSPRGADSSHTMRV